MFLLRLLPTVFSAEWNNSPSPLKMVQTPVSRYILFNMVKGLTDVIKPKEGKVRRFSCSAWVDPISS